MTNESLDRFSLLLVDDETSTLSSLKRVFGDEPYRIHIADSGRSALAHVDNNKIDAALVDLRMPEMDGLTLLKEIKRREPGVMVLMMTGHGGIEDAVQAIRAGAEDFLEKPFSTDGILNRVARFYEVWSLKRENRRLQDQNKGHFNFDSLVGDSIPMVSLKKMIARLGPSDASVLIQGETGTGKELVAKAVHAHSLRSENPFVPVDCAAISETVIESELFGHLKGSFTGAHANTIGLIRSADSGTLFLDEIGELPQSMQAKLLRTIQELEVRPVGGNKTFPVNVRVLSATNRELTMEAAEGRFREDLLFRLNVVTLNLPPLRERKGDLPLLTRYFLDRYVNETSPVKEVTEEVLRILEGYSWPGNVRELQNVIMRAVALGSGDQIRPEDLPQSLLSAPDPEGALLSEAGETMTSYEIEAIRNALQKSGKNRKEAARILDIGEATLYRKLKKYNLE